MNGYIAFYRNKKCEVWANTTIEAMQKARIEFKARSVWGVTVVLAEKNDQPVIHSTGGL